YARDILRVGPEGLGLLYAAIAVGSLVTAVWMSLHGSVRRAGLLVLVGVTIYGATLVLFAVSDVFWWSVLTLAGAGAGNTMGAVTRQTINQLSVPDELRGRVTSVNSIFTSGGPRLGQFEAGLTASWWGPVGASLVGGLVVLALVAAAMLPRGVR